MDSNWWWNKKWMVRDEGPLGSTLKPNGKYGKFCLEPNTSSGNPSFFWLRFDEGCMHPCWKNRYFYSVGATAPLISALPAWNDLLPASGQPDVAKQYTQAGETVRSLGSNPYTARLEGHIQFNGAWEIIRLFCFQGIQENGNDWIVIDSWRNAPHPEQDGTGHGDPP
jgi:hypothetical protein